MISTNEEKVHQEKAYQELVKATNKVLKIEQRNRVFWNTIHNIKGAITFFITLPVMPIVYIILAIRGEFE
jgi:hypothetical protein